MSHNQTTDNKRLAFWINHSIVVLLWILLLLIFLFSLFNIAVYLLVPVDGAEIWVRQGPVRVLDISVSYPDEAGLQPEDVIVNVQDHNLDWWLAQRWQTVPDIIRRIGQPRPTTEMTVLRKAETLTLTVPLHTRLGGVTRYQFFAHMFVGYAFLIAGIIILVGGKGATIERLAVLIMALMALIEQNELLLAFGAEWAWSMLWLFIPLRLLTRWFAYSSALHFSLVFPHPKAWLKRMPYLPWLIHLLNPVVTIAIMLSVAGNLHFRHAVAYSPSKDIYIVYLLLACIFLAHSYITARDIDAKNQLRWIAWGVVMAVVPNILLSDLPFVLFGYKLLPSELSSLLLLFIPISIVVAVLHYRLWNIELIIRISLLYVTLTVLLGVIYVSIVSFLIAVLGVFSIGPGDTGNSLTVFFVSALIVAFLFAPARDYLQRLIDRIFFRHKLDYPKLLARFSRELSTSLLLDDLLKLLNLTIPQQLGLRTARVWLNSDLPADSFRHKDLQQGRIIWAHNKADGTPPTLPKPIRSLDLAGIWSCVPLLSGENLMGLYGLGAKKSGEYYSREDIDLLETVARQAGVALHNAQFHRQLADQVRIQRDLEIASQIQTSLLPMQDPELSGFEIVSYSRPANEVGGDFYHYVSFDDNNCLGVAVGDVSGKGVPAALFMAVAISTLRAQAPHYYHDSAALLTAVNKILYPQMSISYVNTAMLYAIIEKHSGGKASLTVSNGGLIWPLLRRANGHTEYVHISGFPIGTMPNAPYQSFQLQLRSGDVIILTSDGLVEAMNGRKELFGFERLRQCLADCDNDMSAGDLLKHLKESVFMFMGQAEPHDDITVIAIRVI